MAYTTKYGDWSGSIDLNNDTSKSRSRLFLRYEVVETPTQYKVNYYFGFQIEVRVKLSYKSIWISNSALTVVDNSSPIKSTEATFGELYIDCTKPNTVTRTTSSVRTWTYNKTHSSFTRKFTINTKGKIGKAFSVSFTIPAKPSYDVIYNADGGSGAPVTGKKWYGESLTLSSIKPTKSGYTFLYWSSGSKIYNPGSKYTDNSKITLKAIWTANKYTLSYDLNGASITVPSQVIPYNSQFTFYGSIAEEKIKLTRSGYEFRGWSYCGKTYYDNTTYSTKYTTIGNTIAKANWRPAESTITFKFKDNSGNYISKATVTVNKNVYFSFIGLFNNDTEYGEVKTYKEVFSFQNKFVTDANQPLLRYDQPVPGIDGIIPVNDEYVFYAVYKEYKEPGLFFSSVNKDYSGCWGSSNDSLMNYSNKILLNFKYKLEEDMDNTAMFGTFRFLKNNTSVDIDKESFAIYITDESGNIIQPDNDVYKIQYTCYSDTSYVYISYKFNYDGISSKNKYNVNLIGKKDFG